MIEETTAEAEILPGFTVTYTLYSCNTDTGVSYSVGASSKEECSVAHDITNDRHLAVRIFNMIHRGKVPPCTLLETAEDLIEALL